MTVRVACDICGGRYCVQHDRVGTVVRCNHCGAGVQVPARAADADGLLQAEVLAARRARSRRRSSAMRSASTTAGAAAGSVAGILIVLCLIGARVWLRQEARQERQTRDVAEQRDRMMQRHEVFGENPKQLAPKQMRGPAGRSGSPAVVHQPYQPPKRKPETPRLAENFSTVQPIRRIHPPKQMRQFNVTAVAYSPDGRRLLGMYRDGFVRSFDPVTGKKEREIRAEKSEFRGITTTADGRLVAIAHWKTLLSTEPTPLSIWDWESEELSSVTVPFPYDAMALSPDGSRVLIPRRPPEWRETAPLLLIDLHTGETRDVPLDAEVQQIAWSRDGKRIVLALRDAALAVLDGETFEELHRIRTEPVRPLYKGVCQGLSLFPASGTAVGCYINDGRQSLRLWSIDEGRLLKGLRGTAYNCVTFLQPGDRLAAGSRNGMVDIWNISTEQIELRLQTDSDWTIAALALSPDLQHIAVGSNDGKIFIFPSP